MHGVVMAGLQSFVQDEEGRRTWNAIKESAGIDRTTYSRMEDYPDEEFKQIYSVLVDEYGMNGDQLQREFGQYLFEALVDIYERIYFDEGRDALTMIDSVEETIHQSLKQRRGVTFTPPELETDRIGEDRVAVVYSSDRHLCELAKGMIRGVEAYYETSLDIEETMCMKDDDERCRLLVTATTDSQSGESIAEHEDSG